MVVVAAGSGPPATARGGFLEEIAESVKTTAKIAGRLPGLPILTISCPFQARTTVLPKSSNQDVVGTKLAG